MAKYFLQLVVSNDENNDTHTVYLQTYTEKSVAETDAQWLKRVWEIATRKETV